MIVNIRLLEEATQWFQDGKWSNDLSLKVHKSVDVCEFYSQYNKNKLFWDKAFTFLKETDLEHMAPGKYAIEGDSVYVSVAEGITRAIEEIKWEAHRRYIDIQYVVRGREKMGVAPVENAEIISSFDEIRDIGFYNVTGGKYYVAEPGTLFIFFPNDVHRPGIQADMAEENKKIVIKIKAF